MEGAHDRPNRDDFALMRAICERDAEALSHLLDRYGPLLLGLCRRILHDSAEADDVLAEVFAELWRRGERYDSSRGSPLTYLITLTRSRAIDRKRLLQTRRRKDSGSAQLGVQLNPELGPLGSSDLEEQAQRVRQALASLDADQRQALECSFFEGLSHSEIAELLNKPLGTVKTNIRQGLIRLRECLRNV